MSASGKFRRKVKQNLKRGQVEAMLAESDAARPEYVGPMGVVDGLAMEGFTIGPSLVVVPVLDERLHPAVLNGLDRRRRANLTGLCDCGARRRVVSHGGALHLCFEHESTCAAGDERLGELLDRYGTPTASTGRAS